MRPTLPEIFIGPPVPRSTNFNLGMVIIPAARAEIGPIGVAIVLPASVTFGQCFMFLLHSAHGVVAFWIAAFKAWIALFVAGSSL
jgi:hypothetical protein